MSVISCEEIWNGREGSVDQNFLRRYVRVFRVITNDPNDEASIVGAATGIPALYDTYVTANASDLGSRVIDIQPSQSEDNPRFWQVAVEYSGAENPPEVAPDVKWGSNKEQRTFERDIFGDAILNSAGQFFDPPPEGDDSRPTLVITRNETLYNPALATIYQDAVNSDTWTIVAPAMTPFVALPGEAKCMSIEAQYHEEKNYAWWSVTYSFEFRRVDTSVGLTGWIKQILDQGRYQRSTDDTNKLTPCLDDKGQPVDDPVPLDGSGAQLSDPSPTNAVWLTRQVYKQLPFTALALP
jgi:hypothetical protein